MMEIQSNIEYQDWLKALKEKVSVARVKAALAANKELIHFYFDLGRMITEQQSKAAWGDKLLNQLSKDLSAEFPDLKGFSITNLKYCKQFYQFYQSEISQQTVDQLTAFDFGQHIVDQLPWGHNVLIFTKSKSKAEAEFALRDINKPMGMSEFKLTEIVPEDLKSSLPTIEEIEQTLKTSSHE
ncbi:MAG: DUF1016 family protein [Lunatimonas sp.]|uniref:DUF1016 N-terminal domain-containing protein n=1 Tax=Lunatimonas sp. TaxID=2060141 RepID=UPI00263BA134|nr:DUF1016 N-terminal domain-containing protein [Lunatimonas sp.]MCC5938161.1 DUF1016 family protein [Lunatimonas sp.]